jgi:membrane fusion protein
MNKGQSNHISFQVAPDRMPSPSGNGDQERLRQRRGIHSKLQVSRDEHLLTGVGMLLCLVMIILLASVKYRETLALPGVLENAGGDIKVSSTQPGVIESINVSTGDFVEVGTVLLTIGRSIFDASGVAYIEQDRQRLRARSQQLAEEKEWLGRQYLQQAQLVEERVKQSEARTAEIEAGKVLIRRQLAISEDQLSRLKSLVDSGGLTLFEFEKEQMQHLELLSRQTGLNRQAQDIILDSQSLRAQLLRLQIDLETSDKEIAEQLTELKYQQAVLSRNSSLALVAQEAGVISGIMAGPGAQVVPGEPLIYVQPQEFDVLAMVFVPGSAVGKLEPGQQALLRYDSFDHHSYGRYEATIFGIERSSLDPRDHMLPLTQIGEPVFRVSLRPDQHYVEGPDIYPLLPGMTFTADIVMHEMTLIQFMLKPFLGLRGKLT